MLPNLFLSLVVLIAWSGIGVIAYRCCHHQTPTRYVPLWIGVEAMAIAGVVTALHSRLGWVANALDIMSILMFVTYYLWWHRFFREE